MKKGTNVGLDKNYKNVCVGDQIKDWEGYIYTIDKYVNAVRNGDGASFPLHKVQPFELYQPEPVAPEPEPTQEEPAVDPGPLLKGFNPGDTSVHDAPDQMLADELRRRGYEVKATKTTIVEL